VYNSMTSTSELDFLVQILTLPSLGLITLGCFVLFETQVLSLENFLSPSGYFVCKALCNIRALDDYTSSLLVIATKYMGKVT